MVEKFLRYSSLTQLRCQLAEGREASVALLGLPVVSAGSTPLQWQGDGGERVLTLPV